MTKLEEELARTRDNNVRLGRLPSGRECLEGSLAVLKPGEQVRVVGQPGLYLVGPIVWRAGMRAKALIKEISDGE